MISIRRFLITLLLAIIVLTVFLSVLQGYRASYNEIQQQMDAKLLDLAKLLSEQEIDNNKHIIHTGEKYAFQIIPSNGKKEVEAFRSMVSLLKGFGKLNFDNHRWRSYVYLNKEKNVWVIVAEREDIRFDLAEKTVLKSLGPIIIALPLTAILIWFIVGYALKPLDQLSRALKNKQEKDLSPLFIKHSFIEVDHVIKATNRLLRRLALSFKREKHFASDAAHELKTPLSVLKIDLFNLEKELGAKNKNVQALNQGVQRMERLVQQILSLYRTTPDKFMATFSVFDLNEVAKQVLINLYEYIDKKRQLIELQGDTALMLGDKSAIEVLLVNLIENANKYTPELGRILVTIMVFDSKIQLDVEDSGIGINEKEYQRVFERFYREGGDQHSSKEQGCGLGLSIVKHIVELHNAEISLSRSRFKTGLKVSVVFPKGNINEQDNQYRANQSINTINSMGGDSRVSAKDTESSFLSISGKHSSEY